MRSPARGIRSQTAILDYPRIREAILGAGKTIQPFGLVPETPGLAIFQSGSPGIAPG